MFTFAGTRLMAPLDPFPLLFLVALTSFAVAAKASVVRGRWMGIAVTILANVLLMLVASGIARAYFDEILPKAAAVFGVALAGSAVGAALALRRASETASRLSGASSNRMAWCGPPSSSS
jgi:uncharacterized membrane protein YccC